MRINSISNNKYSLRTYLVLLFVSFSTLTLSGCFGVDSDNELPPKTAEPETLSVTNPEPEPEVSGLSALHTDGTKWVNASGETVLLKGTNLGNWLLHEFWMMNQSSNTVATDQCTLEATFDERFGFDERERLLDVFRDNWITERDWDVIESFGLNAIRLPFVWNVIEDENNPMTLRDDAWQYIDYAIEEAEAHGMYVILDLHGAVGAQGWNDHSGCAGQNLYWSTPEFQERTTWLWQQIAERYKNNGTVAAYGILNEPWGTEPDVLADVMIELYKDVREIDSEKIIVLPGHFTGIDEYGHPNDFGGTNVAFEMHFYPGFFGWGDPTYETHRDWLGCGESGTDGICAWNAKMESLSSPLLVGEFQPWANIGYEFGGENTRATYDKYAEFNWASINWAYKVLTGGGGQGEGTWGMVTNQKVGLGIVAKASTWDCAGWDSSLADACAVAADTITPVAEGLQTYYLVVKFGACCDGSLDVSLDKLSLVDEDNNELILDGDFGSSSNWTNWTVSVAPVMNFNETDNATMPTGGDAPYLRMTGTTDSAVTDFNGGIYQAITLEGGKNYTLSGVFKDNGSVNSWAEIYITAEVPVDGVDIIADEALPSLDFANDSIEAIEAVFELYGTLEYEVHQPLLNAMTATSTSELYTLPTKPTGLSVTSDNSTASLIWDANLEADVTGYDIYRSINNNASYQLLAENVASSSYSDATISENKRYYYKVVAVDAHDYSYASDEVVTGTIVHDIPGIIQAEDWNEMNGFEVEATSDTDGGRNTGFANPGDWLEYKVNIAAAGDYDVEYRLATETGSDGFTVTVNGTVIDTVLVDATGGWQTWVTQTSSVSLPAGEHTIRLDSVGEAWNFNWMRLSEKP